MPSTQPLAYTALDRSTQSFRLIEVLPGDSQQISCKFHIHQVGANAACPPFTALSYTWGPPDSTSLIIIDNQSFPVRKNLWSALSSYRKKINDGTFRGLLWVDAVCINQQDTRERSHQVNMMDAIFSQANTVLVWLGPEEDDSSRVLEYIRTMPSLDYEKDQGPPSSYARLLPKPEYQGIQFVIPKPDFTIDDLFQELFDQQLDQAFLALFQRAYWTRMWIVQEVLLAKNLVILCGDQLCDWSTMVSIASDLLYLGRFLGLDGLPVDKFSNTQISTARLRHLQSQIVGSPAYYILTKGMDSSRLQQREAGWEIRELIQTWYQQECADPRDRVYALLGLSRGEIRADYDKTLEDVFGDVVTSQRPEMSDQDYATFVTALTKALYLDPPPEKIEDLGRIAGIDLEDELGYVREIMLIGPKWPSEQDHTAEDGASPALPVKSFNVTTYGF
ncbi:heterokaryon incompatibility protein-domain-containing protein [Lophiotrema nucula]|uniref:Heterokaryon incompatibility protein-domain-containing protein n=1 Tax=Lophiotrema nucula TaxID=690887 RepID=A0A6A5ZGA0_9PLEO|nr:heterokaryon incompatibility protein-domain-containing protein [Lophiotrema nucula]